MYDKVKNQELKDIILQEMVARVVKNKLHQNLRSITTSNALAQDIYYKCVLDFFNLVLGHGHPMVCLLFLPPPTTNNTPIHSKSQTQDLERFWGKEMPEALSKHFSFKAHLAPPVNVAVVNNNDKVDSNGRALDDECYYNQRGEEVVDNVYENAAPNSRRPQRQQQEQEQKKEEPPKEKEEAQWPRQQEEPVAFDIRGSLNFFKLFKRIHQLTGVKFSKQSRRELKKNPEDFKLVIPDIVALSVKVNQSHAEIHKDKPNVPIQSGAG